MLLCFDKVMHIVEVLCVVKEFFGNAGFEEATGDFIGFTFTVVLFPGGRGLGFPKISQMLSRRRVGHIVLMIGIAFVAYDTDTVKSFISTFAKSEMVGGLLFNAFAKKDCPLKRVWNFRAGEAEPGLGHIDKTDKPFDYCAGIFCRIEVLEFFGYTDHERAVNTAGIAKTFAAG